VQLKPDRWKPLVQGEDAGRLLALCFEQVRWLEMHALSLSGDASFASGLAGLALFYAQLALTAGEGEWRRRAWDSLEEALEIQARQEATQLGFFAGVTGIGWVVHQLSSCLGSTATEGITRDLDEAIATAIEPGPWEWEFDLISGITGIGYYLLDHPDRSFARAQLAIVGERLDEMATRVEGGLCWLTRPQFLSEGTARSYPSGRFDLGLAHGVGGAIGFLAQVCRSGIGGARERALLRAAVRWLLGNRRQETTGSSFSRFAPPAAPFSCRSAWCSGDPGIATVLMAAARAEADARLWREATSIGLVAASRPVDEAEVSDASLCHGSAGLCHIFNWLWQCTGEEAFRQAALFWLRETERYIGEQRAQDAGLLLGRVGTTLAILAAVSGEKPIWAGPMMLGW
jgi:lantibiotic modifying enzyme